MADALERTFRDDMRRLGAELSGQRKSASRSADDQHSGAVGSQDLKSQETQGSATDDGRGLAGSHRGLGDRADHHGQRLGDHEVVVGNTRWGRPATPLWYPCDLGKTAIDVDTYCRAAQAEVAIAPAAERTGAAGVVGLDGDPRPRLDSRHARTDVGHQPHELMAGHQRIRHGTVPGPDAIVRSA